MFLCTFNLQIKETKNEESNNALVKRGILSYII